LYPVHLSGLFLKTEALSSAIYLIVILFLRRDYDSIAKITSTAHSDTPLTEEENWVLSMITQTVLAGASPSHPPDFLAQVLRKQAKEQVSGFPAVLCFPRESVGSGGDFCFRT
jgi:hypothetical protein